MRNASNPWLAHLYFCPQTGLVVRLSPAVGHGPACVAHGAHGSSDVGLKGRHSLEVERRGRGSVEVARVARVAGARRKERDVFSKSKGTG